MAADLFQCDKEACVLAGNILANISLLAQQALTPSSYFPRSGARLLCIVGEGGDRR